VAWQHFTMSGVFVDVLNSSQVENKPAVLGGRVA
jgi:hypothetical protein